MKYRIILKRNPTVVLLILLAIRACDGGDQGSIDDALIAFSPIPECGAEYFLDNPTGCDFTGEQFEFGIELRRAEPVGNIGSAIGNEIEWDILSCSSIIFTGEVSGTLRRNGSAKRGNTKV